MLTTTFTTWAPIAVVGVGLVTAVVLWHLNRLLPTNGNPGLWIGWLCVAAGPIVSLPTGTGGPHGVGGAIVIAGLVVLGSVLRGAVPENRAKRVGWVLGVGAVLVASALLLPEVVWRGVAGASLLATSVWLATRVPATGPRRLFNLGLILLACAGIGLTVGVLRPSFGVSADGAVGIVLLGGLVALGSATVIFRATGEVSSLNERLAGLEEEYGHLLRLSESDPLTGCPTRQALRAWFERWEGGEPVSVVLIDIDNLKRINERHGHAAGDEALRLVAGVLTASIRPGDLVVRWGGDEFVTVLRGAAHEAAKRRFTTLIGEVQETAKTFPYEETLRVDWGVAACTVPSDISKALAEADENMYAMKRRRRT
jgi:diguanylate cyclase (GGDEF)-like protein